MSTCKNCGAEIAEGTKFCSECGAKQEEIKVCGKCGAELSEEMDFCGECGEPVKTVQPIAEKTENESGAEKRSSQPAEGVQSVSGKTKNEFPQKAKEFWQKLSILKKSGIIIAVAIVVLGIFAGNSSTEPTSTPTSAPASAPTPDISVKAEEMMDDYIRDQGTAEAKYKGKQIHITGTALYKRQFNNSQDYNVVLIDKSAAGRNYNILLDVGEKNIKALNELKKGDFVVADGICVGVVKQKDPTEVSVQITVEKINE